MTGYALEEVIGKTPHILQGPKTDRSVLVQLCKDCAEGKVFHGETVNYRKDRSEFRLEWTAGPVRDERGEVTHFAASQRDVTERWRVEEELRRSEKVFRTLFDLSAIGMAQVSPEGRYLSVNRKLCQMLGYSEQELTRLTLHEVTHPDDRQVSAAKLDASFADGSKEYSIEKRYMPRPRGVRRSRSPTFKTSRSARPRKKRCRQKRRNCAPSSTIPQRSSSSKTSRAATSESIASMKFCVA
jgi:PAS domain S-box-containing protein